MKEEIIVVKLGGTEGVDFSAICMDAVELLKEGKQLVFVHGGSAEANSLGESLGTPPKMIMSPSGYTSRYTDRKTLEIFLMAVNGKVNSLVTEQLQMLGVNAFGLCGLDGRLMQATRKDSIQSIERGKRLVHEQDLRLHRHRTRNGDSLLHTARQSMRITFCELRQIDFLDEVHGSIACFGLHNFSAGR